MGSKLGPVSAVLVLSFLFLGPGTAEPARAAELLLPDWAAVFNADGSLKDEVDGAGAPGANGVPDYVDLYGGIDAVFLDDNLTAGSAALDMSALLEGDGLVDELAGDGTLDEPTGVADVVYNGVVGAAHDAGDAYLLVERGPGGDLLLYAGIARIASDADTYLESEFNQDNVRVRHGTPWPIHVARRDGDLRVRFNFVAGLLSVVDFERWTGESFALITSGGGIADGNCNESAGYVFCLGAPPIDGDADELWDADGTPVAYAPPDSFAEVGINVNALLGQRADYTTVQIRTPEDISLGSVAVNGGGA